ncbi:MAG: hypothetical protein PHY08_13490, partial [Candidatus Cloacimonetes bacterium]|nr:hypothetical protein [Candidatus Cloacimonadota bacterium]
EIRKLEYGIDDTRCIFCGKSIWDIEMVLGINDKHMCIDCGEDFINATFFEYKTAINNGEVSKELIERLSNHAIMLKDVIQVLENYKKRPLNK